MVKLVLVLLEARKDLEWRKAERKSEIAITRAHLAFLTHDALWVESAEQSGKWE
jgi:hypothetical protein